MGHSEASALSDKGRTKTLAHLRWTRRWASHMGCLKGCLDYLDMRVSDAWLYGATGHAFVINIAPGTCPSGPRTGIPADFRNWAATSATWRKASTCIAPDTYPFRQGDDEAVPADDRAHATAETLRQAREAEAAGLAVLADLVGKLNS